MNAIELNHIHKSFGGFAIQDLSLTVPSGTICGLVGENGAGKSTTIRLLMNALRPDGGTARVLGVDVSSPGVPGREGGCGRRFWTRRITRKPSPPSRWGR